MNIHRTDTIEITEQTMTRKSLKHDQDGNDISDMQQIDSVKEQPKQVITREIRPDDVHALEALYRSLSPNSIYNRYMRHSDAPLGECSEICMVGRTIDGAAIVVTDANDDHIIGVAHYIASDNNCAEPAIIVADEYQSRGIGTALFRHLCEMAHERGIRTFEAFANSSNRDVVSVIQKSGYKVKSSYEYGQRRIQIDLGVTTDENL